ncbi:MAG: DUF2442 domain-containing protein [Flavobacteriales bacterium]
MRSSKLGKTTSAKTEGRRPADPIDRLIIDGGLRIKDVYIRKDLDLLMVVLNNGSTIRSTVSDHPRLKSAKQSVLEQWQLIAGGRGIHWETLDEDLSLRGFIVETSVRNAIASLSRSKDQTPVH